MTELRLEDLSVRMVVLFTQGDDEPADITDCDLTMVDSIDADEVVLYTGHIYSPRILRWSNGRFTSSLRSVRHRLWREE